MKYVDLIMVWNIQISNSLFPQMERILAVVLKEFSSHENITIDVHEKFVKITTPETSVTINNCTTAGRESVNGLLRRPGNRSATYAAPQRVNHPQSVPQHVIDPPKINSDPVITPLNKSDEHDSAPYSRNYAAPRQANNWRKPPTVATPKIHSDSIMSQLDPSSKPEKCNNGSINVVTFDQSKDLYCEFKHKFVLKQVGLGEVKVIGKADGSNIIPLTLEEETIARTMGFVLE